MRQISDSDGVTVFASGTAIDRVRVPPGAETVRFFDRYHLVFSAKDAAERQLAELTLFELVADHYESEIDVNKNIENLKFLLELVLPAGRGNTTVQTTILDYGCGTGLIRGVMGETQTHVVGCDLSPKMRDIAAMRGLVVIDDEELRATPPGSFDGAVASYVLHLAAGRDSLADVVGVLRPGARLAANFHKGAGLDEAENELTKRGDTVRHHVGDHPGGHGVYAVWERLPAD